MGIIFLLEIKEVNQIYNFMFDTSNIEKADEKYEARMKLIKYSWNKITNHFLEKGKRIKLKYWPDDVPNGYSGYGITEIYESDKSALQEIDIDGLFIVNANINNKVRELFQKSMTEEHVFISPFFHFDIINDNGISIFTSQDNGDNTLMHLTEKDFALVDEFLIISLPET